MQTKCVLDVEVVVNIAADRRVGLNDLLQLDLDEVVVGVNVLLHQPLDLQESRKQIPLVTSGVDGVGQRLVVVEWLENGIEGLLSSR